MKSFLLLAFSVIVSTCMADLDCQCDAGNFCATDGYLKHTFDCRESVNGKPATACQQAIVDGAEGSNQTICKCLASSCGRSQPLVDDKNKTCDDLCYDACWMNKGISPVQWDCADDDDSQAGCVYGCMRQCTSAVRKKGRVAFISHNH